METYRDNSTFSSIFNPDAQYDIAADPRRCFMGDAPTLNVVAEAFGRAAAVSWLAVQLNDLAEFSGCRDKMGGRQMERVAMVILTAYGHLKATELMYFFLLFKSGRFGRFYGAVDGLAITEALCRFQRLRDERLQAYEREADEAAAQEGAPLRQRLLSMAEAVRENPDSLMRGVLVRAYDDGTLRRLGIEWRPGA